jgi:putative MATE family efflux protein
MKRIDKFIQNPKKALFILSGPLIIGMIVQTLYNVIDTAFVGRIGADALASITFSFPLFFILIALNAGVGSGTTSRIARYLGEKNIKAAENTAMHGILINLIIGTIILILSPFFLKPLLSLFGAENNILQLSIDYMSIIIYGIFFMFLLQAFSSIFSGQGDTKTTMKVQISALLLNILLDYLFIFKFNMGVKGAALATIISFFIGVIIYLFYMKKSILKINFKIFKLNKEIIKDIMYVGFPASLMMLIISIYVIFINRYMIHFSYKHVAAFGIASRIDSIAMLPIVGLGIALITLVGMFYGAKRLDLVKEISWFSLKVGIIFSIIMAFIFLFLLKPIYLIFTNDAEVIKFGIEYMKINLITFPFMAIGMMISRIMQGLGLGKPGLIINIIRTFFLAIPLSYIFIFILGYDHVSIAWAGVIGGLISSIVAIIWLIYEFKKIKIN